MFDGLNATRGFDGFVLFLEEDHYVSKDFIHTTKKLIELKRQSCDDCDFINLGMYIKVKTYANVAHKVSYYFSVLEPL